MRICALLERWPVLGDRLVQRCVFRSMAEAAAVRKGESVCGVAHALRWLATSVPRQWSAKVPAHGVWRRGEGATRHRRSRHLEGPRAGAGRPAALVLRAPAEAVAAVRAALRA